MKFEGPWKSWKSLEFQYQKIVETLDMTEDWHILVDCVSLGEAQRDCALKLVSLIITAYGIEWLNAGVDEPCLFLMLAVRLSCIEVQMILEEQSYDSVSIWKPFLCS